jgi:hypothetical protein
VLGPISDVLAFSFGSSGRTIDFVSDVDGAPFWTQYQVESGTVFDASSVAWTLADGSTVVDTVAFISEIFGDS